LDDADFRSWHDAERAVRDLEQRLLVAKSPRVAAPEPILQELNERLAQARVAADKALSDCLRDLTRQRRKQRVAAGSSRSSESGDSQ
jgi:uncharacterized coiled-coil protein SlyX